MKFYPIFVRLDGRPCIVIGGGEVAERKVGSLLDAGARVTLISPEVTAGLARRISAGEIAHQGRAYRRGDLQGAFLAYAATGDEAANAEIAGEAREGGVLLNAVDQPAFCDFIVPAVVERGDLVIATSTSGASPMMARRIREELESRFGPEYAEALRILRGVRERLAGEGRPFAERKRVLAEILDAQLVDLVRAGDREAIERLVAGAVGSGFTSDRREAPRG